MKHKGWGSRAPPLSPCQAALVMGGWQYGHMGQAGEDAVEKEAGVMFCICEDCGWLFPADEAVDVDVALLNGERFTAYGCPSCGSVAIVEARRRSSRHDHL